MAIDSGSYTPETVARRLKMAESLLGAPQKPITHWAEGLNELLKGYEGGRQYRKAEDMEREGNVAQNRAMAELLGVPAPVAGAPAPTQPSPPASPVAQAMAGRPPVSAAPAPSQNLPGPVAANDPTMSPSPRQVAAVNGAPPMAPGALQAPPPIAFGDGMTGQPNELPPPGPAAPQIPQGAPSDPAMPMTSSAAPQDIKAKISAMLTNPNPVVQRMGRQFAMQALAQQMKPNEPDFGIIGQNDRGEDQRGWIDKRARTVSPATIPGAAAPAQGAPAIPPPPPGVDPKQWYKERGERVINDSLPASSDVTSKLRNEVQGLPSYKNLAQAAPVYRSMREAAGRDNRAADVNMIYGLGKIMDPTSVVRESEMTIAQMVATLPQQLRAQVQSQLEGTGRLSPEVRQSIMREAHSRLSAYQQGFGQDVGMYRGIAQRGRMNEADVIPDFGTFEGPDLAAAPPASGPDLQKAVDEARRRGLIK